MKTDLHSSMTDADLVAQIQAAQHELQRRVQERRKADSAMLNAAGVASVSRERKTQKVRVDKNAAAA